MAEDGLSPLAVCSMLINVCMGIGFLTLPYSTLKLGLLPALATTLGLGALAICTALWLVTALSLTSALIRNNPDPEASLRSRRHSLCGKKGALPEHSEFGACEIGTQTKDKFRFSSRLQLCFVELIGHHFGEVCKQVTMVMMTLILVLTMWSWAAIFASSMAAMVAVPFVGQTCDVYSEWNEPGCKLSYHAYLALFATLMVILARMEAKETQYFQFAMTGCRMLLGVAIVGTCLRMLYLGEAPPYPERPGTDTGSHGASIEGASHTYHPERFPDIPAPDAFHIGFAPEHVSLVILALSVHNVMPETIHELVDKKRNLVRVVGMSLLLCTLMYSLVSFVVVETFGAWTRPVCTLNWVNYTAGEKSAGAFTKIIKGFIMLVPAFDVGAAYPIFAQSLASNLGCVLGSSSSDDGKPSLQLRLACTLCPLLGAACIYDVARTLGWCGVMLVPFIFVVPQLLLLKSASQASKEFGENEVHASTFWRWYCDSRLVYASLVVGLALTLIAIFPTWADAVL